MKLVTFALAATISGALIASTFKSDQVLLSGIFLTVITGTALYSAIQKRSIFIFFLKMLLALTTGTIGYLTESWGTTNGHWTYHFLPAGQTVPMWVPLAWAIAAELIFKLETEFAHFKTLNSHPVVIMSICGVVFPLIGESVCIANGVWDYHWPYKIFGVPLLSLVLISWCHVTLSFFRIGMLKELYKERSREIDSGRFRNS